jgi:hypothetical protein
MEPSDQSQWQKVDNEQFPLTMADSAGKGKTSEAPPPPLKAWYLIGPRWGGAQDNELYGGISIKTQKSEYEKIRISNAWSIEKCATPKQYTANADACSLPKLFSLFFHFDVCRFCTGKRCFGYFRLWSAMRVFVEVLVCDLKKKSFGGQVLGGPLEYGNKTCFGKSKRIYQNLFAAILQCCWGCLYSITLFKSICLTTSPTFAQHCLK